MPGNTHTETFETLQPASDSYSPKFLSTNQENYQLDTEQARDAIMVLGEKVIAIANPTANNDHMFFDDKRRQQTDRLSYMRSLEVVDYLESHIEKHPPSRKNEDGYLPKIREQVAFFDQIGNFYNLAYLADVKKYTPNGEDGLKKHSAYFEDIHVQYKSGEIAEIPYLTIPIDDIFSINDAKQPDLWNGDNT